jgi:hypothetical protein
MLCVPLSRHLSALSLLIRNEEAFLDHYPHPILIQALLRTLSVQALLTLVVASHSALFLNRSTVRFESSQLGQRLVPGR